jgi:hypothetical protein
LLSDAPAANPGHQLHALKAAGAGDKPPHADAEGDDLNESDAMMFSKFKDVSSMHEQLLAGKVIH